MRSVLAMWRFLVLSVLLAAGGSSTPGRASVVGWSIDQLFAVADLVAVIRIADGERLSVDGESCGIRYTADVLELLKAQDRSATRPRIGFGRLDGLQVGEAYLVFLRHQPDVQSAWREVIEAMPTLDARKRFRAMPVPEALLACQGLVPGFNLVSHGAWPMDADRVYAQDFILHSVPASIPLEVSSPVDKALDRANLLIYLRCLR